MSCAYYRASVVQSSSRDNTSVCATGLTDVWGRQYVQWVLLYAVFSSSDQSPASSKIDVRVGPIQRPGDYLADSETWTTL
jgi:hypothetical protein